METPITNDYDTPTKMIQALAAALACPIQVLPIERGHVQRLIQMLESLTAERDEADRRAGAAERELAWYKEQHDANRRWMADIKSEFNVHEYAPFDRVIELARQYRDELRERGECEE